MDKLRDMAATGVRIGSGWGASIPAMVPGLGSLAGAGIAGAGEGAAELIEGSPLSPARMGVEAALGAVPLGGIFKAGRVAQSAMRSGALSGAGTLMRQQARGEDVNLREAGSAALIGAATGGVLGHMTGGAPKGPAPEYDVIEQAGGKTGYIQRTPPPSAPPVDPRTAYFAKQGLNPPTAPGRMASAQGELPFGTPEPSVGGGVPTPYGIPAAASNRPSAKAAIAEEAKARAAEATATEEAARAQAIQESIEAGNLTPGAPRISESISAPLPGGGTIRRSIPYKPPVEDQIDDLLGGAGKSVAGRRVIEDIPTPPAEGPITAPVTPSAPTSAEEAFQAWRQRVGLPDTQSTRRDFPWGLVGGETIVERPPTTQASPLEELFTPTPVSPRAPTLKQQAQEESLNALKARLGMEDGPQAAGPVTQDSIQRAKDAAAAERAAYEASKRPGGGAVSAGQGVTTAPEGPVLVPELVQEPSVAPQAVVDVWEEAANAATPVGRGRSIGATPQLPAGPEPESQSALARFFKTRVDAAGQANRDVKAAKAAGEEVNPLARAYTGVSLQNAGLARESELFAKPGEIDPALSRLKNFLTKDLSPEITEKFPPGPRITTTAPGPVEGYVPRTGGMNIAEQVKEAQETLRRAAAEQTLPGQGTPVPPPAPGVSQTSKAREAALAARKAKREAAPPVEPQLNPKELAAKFRELGREDLAQQIESQASKLGGETGAVDVATLAMLLRAGVGAGVGGALGGAAGHPLLGAIGGAAAGAFGPAALSSAAGHLRAAGVPAEVVASLPDDVQAAGVKETAKKIWHTLPQLQRFNYLMDLEGLPANAVVGPYGSAVMAAIEHGLSGDARGWAALKLLSPQRFAQEMKASLAEAGRLIAEGEMGRAETAASLFKKTIKVPGLPESVHPLQVPGQMMTSGDIAARNILHEAGFTEAEARRITLTSEPEAALPRGIANLGRGERDWSTPIGELMLPFKRTPANVWEQGFQRAPLVGFGVQSFRETPDPIKQQVIQQLMSTGVGVGTGVLGASVDPETARWMRRYVSNAGGQYSLPATVGFAAGQAIRGGKPAITEGVKAGINQLPLPTTQPISELVAFLSGEGRAPRGIAPPAVRDTFFPPTPTTSSTGGYDALPGVPSLRSLRGR